jgi:hypothetical protein
MMEFEKYIKLLALAHPTGEDESIGEWCPFAKGDMLCEIIKRHNDRCIQSYWEQWKNPVFIRSNGKGICVEPHNLSTLEAMHDLSTREDIPDKTYFDNIRIILIDLDAIGGEDLKWIKNCFREKTTFVVQVSRTRSTRLIDMGTPFCNVSTEVMVDQETFEKWLISKFCDAYRTSLKEGTTLAVSKLSSLRSEDDLAAIMAYVEALPEVAAEVRDTAIIKGLSEEKTVTLAQQAVVQEFTLTGIEARVRSQTNFSRILLDAIREPVVDMPIELGFQSPALRQVNLVELHVTQPMYEMTAEQRNIMHGFGIKEEVEPFVAVFPDQPTVWDSVKRLKSVSKTTKFSAELSVGLRGMR